MGGKRSRKEEDEGRDGNRGRRSRTGDGAGGKINNPAGCGHRADTAFGHRYVHGMLLSMRVRGWGLSIIRSHRQM